MIPFLYAVGSVIGMYLIVASTVAMEMFLYDLIGDWSRVIGVIVPLLGLAIMVGLVDAREELHMKEKIDHLLRRVARRQNMEVSTRRRGRDGAEYVVYCLRDASTGKVVRDDLSIRELENILFDGDEY